MLKFNALNPLTVAIMCLFVWSLESCAPESKLNRLSVADTTCISFSDSEIKQRFDLIGFNLDQYLSDEIIDNPTLYKMAKDGFGALGLKSLKAIQRIDRDIQANPVAAKIEDENGKLVRTDRARRFMVELGPIDQPIQPVDGSGTFVTRAITALATPVGEKFALPYRITIANNSTAIDKNATVESNMKALLHELGHVITEYWQMENQKYLFADNPSAFADFVKEYKSSQELQSNLLEYSTSHEKELWANAFQASRCGPDSYLVGMKYIPVVMKMLNKHLPVPQWRHRARQLAMPGLKVLPKKEELWLAMAPTVQKAKLCEGSETHCTSNEAKFQSLFRPKSGHAWGVHVGHLPLGKAAAPSAQKVITIFAQDDRGDDYFYTIKLER